MPSQEPSESTETIEDVTTRLQRELTLLYGPILSGDRLAKALGYPTQDALRHDMARKPMPVPIFPLHKRGKYALVSDVARWLAIARCAVLPDNLAAPE